MDYHRVALTIASIGLLINSLALLQARRDIWRLRQEADWDYRDLRREIEKLKGGK